MQWTKEADEELMQLWVDGLTDKQIAQRLENATVYAVGKRRCFIGAVLRRVKKHNRKPKKSREELKALIIGYYYDKNATVHFVNMGNDDSKIESIAHKYMKALGIGCFYVSKNDKIFKRK